MVVLCLGKKESKLRQRHQCLKIMYLMYLVYQIFHPLYNCPVSVTDHKSFTDVRVNTVDLLEL